MKKVENSELEISRALKGLNYLCTKRCDGCVSYKNPFFSHAPLSLIPERPSSSTESTTTMPTYSNEAKNDSSREAKLAEYEKVKKNLKELIAKKRAMDKSLNTLEEQLYKLEGAYLEDTPSGNVVRGFENYVKGSQTKKRIGLSEQDRVFSMSSAVFLKAKMKEEDEKNQ